MKKFIALALALALVLSFAACGAKPASTPATSDAHPSGLEYCELTWYVPGPWPKVDQEVVFEEVNKILLEELNCKVNFRPFSYGDYNDKISTVIAAGDDWDIAFTSNWANNYTANASKGAFLDITELVKEYAPNTYALVTPSFWEAAKVNGKIYGIVNEQVSARISDITMPKEFYEASGYDFDKQFVANDLSSLEPYIAYQKEKYPDNFGGFALTNAAEYLRLDMLGGFVVPGAVDVDAGNLTVVNQFKTDAMKKHAALMRDWNEKGYLGSERLIATQGIADRADEDAMLCNFSAGGTYKPGVEAETNSGRPFESVVFASGKPILTTGGITATMQAINANSKNPERALMVLELFNAPKAGETRNHTNDVLNYGIEGTHWNYTEDGHVETTQLGKDNYPGNMTWMWASAFQATPEIGKDLSFAADTRAFNNSADVSPACGFAFDGEPVKTEIANCTAVIEEYRVQIQLGMLDEAGYEEFLTKLDGAGADVVIAEMQAQLDAWAATK